MKEDTRGLLIIAEDDLKVAKDNYKLNNYVVVTFHCQQSVEKYLKAYLNYKTGFHPFVNSITYLIKKCMKLDKDFEYLKDIKANILEEYYIAYMYPTLMKITEEDAKESIDIAEKVREFILKKLNIQ
ncbi:DNA-binding protein [Nanoarchaeota archaeon]